MSFDELQLAWQQQRAAQPKPAFAQATLREVRTQSRAFTRMIFWRDVREVLASLVVAGVFGNFGWQAHQAGAVSWPAWTAAAAAAGVGIYFLIDRWIMRRRAAPQGEDLRTGLQRSVEGVEPLLIAVQITFYGPEDAPLWSKIMVWAIIIGTTGWFDKWIWQLNQNAVRDDLEPRRQNLQAQLREFDAAS